MIRTYLLDHKYLDVRRLDWLVVPVEIVDHNDKFVRSIREFDSGGYLIVEATSLYELTFCDVSDFTDSHSVICHGR
jgi:hypothetical protein